METIFVNGLVIIHVKNIPIIPITQRITPQSKDRFVLLHNSPFIVMIIINLITTVFIITLVLIVVMWYFLAV